MQLAFSMLSKGIVNLVWNHFSLMIQLTWQIVLLIPLMIYVSFLSLKSIILSSKKLLNYCVKQGTWPVHLGNMFQVSVGSLLVKNMLISIVLANLCWIFLAFCSLKRLLHSKANAFLSNDYYDSDIAWMELVSI